MLFCFDSISLHKSILCPEKKANANVSMVSSFFVNNGRGWRSYSILEIIQIREYRLSIQFYICKIKKNRLDNQPRFMSQIHTTCYFNVGIFFYLRLDLHILFMIYMYTVQNLQATLFFS